MPEWITPMAATLTEKRFTSPEWLFERKYDGIRLVAFKQGDVVQLFSRNRLPQHLPAVAAAVCALPVDEVILDDHGGHMFVCSDTDNCEERRAAGHRGALAGHALEAAE